jgi:hypothetical protein
MLNTILSSLESDLSKGEEVLWVGQPKQGVVFNTGDVFLIPFSIVWAGIFLSLLRSLIRGIQQEPFPLVLFVLLFATVAIYLTVGRFGIDAWRRSHTYYVITNQRVLIFSSPDSVRTIMLITLSDIHFIPSVNGRGTIVLGPSNPLEAIYAGMRIQGIGRYLPPTLELIEDAKSVHNLIVQNQLIRQGVGDD